MFRKDLVGENGASDDTVRVASTDSSADLDVLGVHKGGQGNPV